MERLRLLEQVQEKARQVRRILDTVQEGILTLDEDRRVILANPAAERYLSAVADARVGDVLTKIGDKKITDLLMPRPGGLPHIVEITDPEERVFEVLANIFSVGPEIKGWTLLIREATEAHHVQQLAQQRDRLAAVGQLAAGIAHDFNNIMAAIILYAEMLLNSQELGEKSKERLNTILNQAQRAATLTRQILDFSRQAVMEQHPMDLIPFIREFEKLLARTLPESITINLDYDEQDFILRADPGRLQQVFMNLALNARDAMPQGGELTFSLKRINVRTYEIPPIREMPPGEWIQVSVSDTGEGISQEALPHIFEPFFTTKPPGEGTGLGLAQVYGIVKQHDGYINVKSTHGRGAAFNIYLPPMRVAESKYELPQPEDVAHGSGERILVVEDDPATREGVREVLEMLNYQVMVASDGQRAQEIFERGEDHFDLVVTDLVMPGVGGMALYKYLLKNVPGIRIIMMTGYPLGEGTRELLDQGKVTWIQKPLDSEMLGRAVHDALAGEASPAG